MDINMIKEVFTMDNLLHSIVAVAFVLICSTIIDWPFAWAFLVAVILYLREVEQVEGDFSLNKSVHKWAEALVGGSMGFLAALVYLML